MFETHTLGCGSARPSLHHQPSSTVINHRNSLYMVDCGEGAQLALMRQRLPFPKLRHIFLTHLHGDHVFGLPGLIGTLALNNTGGDLTIHTFEEGKKQIKSILDYFCRDTPFEVRFNVIGPEEAVILETKSLTIRTVPLKHRVPCVGYIFEEKPKPRHINPKMTAFHDVPHYMMNSLKEGADYINQDGSVIPNGILTTPADPALSYAHIGDTAYSPRLADMIGPVTLLYHETTYLEEHKAMAAPRGHSTAKEAAAVARDAGAGFLLTGHYSSRYNDDNLFRLEAEEVFPNVILNREGLTVNLEKLNH